MHGATDTLRGRLLFAALRRRAPLWVLTLLPLLWLPLSFGAGLAALPLLLWLAWIAIDIWLWRRRVADHWTAWLDAAVPALEDSSALLDGAPSSVIARLQQKRLQARLVSALGADDYRAIARTRVRFNAAPLLLSLVLAGSVWGWQHKQGVAAAKAVAAPVAKAIVDGEVYLTVAPPAYTGVAAFETAARDIQVPESSVVRWCVKHPAGAAPVVELSDGQVLTVAPDCAQWRATESLFWRARGHDGARYNVRVLADQAPQVKILLPNDLIQVLNKDAKSAALSVIARDDYAVVRASLHMTLARGSGENIRFSDREVPLPGGGDPHVRSWRKEWTLAELGMEPGDELYFFVRATDNAPEHPHTTQSPTYTLRLPGPESEDLDASALPSMAKPESLRSQRQVIIDTEQLVADLAANPKMSAAAQRDRSEAIATDQAALRLRYGQFLGEESNLFGPDHDHEHEGGGAAKDTESTLIAEFGHAHDQVDNATIFDPKTKAVLKRALAAMWDAEKSLRAIAPKTALPPEYKALDAIKELQQAERVYLHRTAFVPPAIKEEKRMSGDIVGALSYKRAQGAASVTVPAEVRDLIQALAGDDALPALWSKAAREVIAAHIAGDEQKLAAQRAVQDVADGCVACRGVLSAYLRDTLTDVPVLLQATPLADTPFRQAWRGKEQP
ncbi:DUF4175 family protein [Rugamonas sp.]|uniref:DUF4175 family protein n=1 Tax=Rugamonas sp. TaxID=1926287 RepID=UPI0025F24214|nr:DUF4175 family protein [Rugamonas sp.]